MSYTEVMRRLGLVVALACLAFGAGCAGAHHENSSMRPGGILASGTCWNVRTHRGTATRTRVKCSDYHPVVYRRRRTAAYAYELPIDPNHPNSGQWSTLVRTHPVRVGYRLRGIFPRVWVVVAVRPLPQDGQAAAVRGWRARRNPIWHGRLVMRPQSPSTNGSRPMPIGTRTRIIPVRPATMRRLKHLHGARFLSPTRLAFLTSGSSSCPSVPARLVVKTPHAIRIDLAIGSWRRTASGLRVQAPHLPPGGACLDNLVASPVVIAINPKQIDVHHRLRVSLYYRKGVIRSSKRPVVFIAPPL